MKYLVSIAFTITVLATGSALNLSKYEIYSDNNDDQQINKGESVKLKIYLKNNGSSQANKASKHSEPGDSSTPSRPRSASPGPPPETKFRAPAVSSWHPMPRFTLTLTPPFSPTKFLCTRNGEHLTFWWP